MRHKMLSALTATAVSFYGLGCSSAASSSQSEVVPAPVADLSGSWVLNPEQSDNPADQLQRGGAQGPRAGGIGGRGGFGGGRGGRGGRGGWGGGRGGGIDREAMREVFRRIREAPARIELAQTDSTVIVTFDTQAADTLYTDGRKIKREFGEGREVEIRARWDAGGLSVERRLGDGIKLTERFVFSSEVNQLFVITRLEIRGQRREIEFRRVYDSAGQPGPEIEISDS